MLVGYPADADKQAEDPGDLEFFLPNQLDVQKIQSKNLSSKQGKVVVKKKSVARFQRYHQMILLEPDQRMSDWSLSKYNKFMDWQMSHN